MINQEVEFREIILKSFQKIFEMSCRELKQQKRVLMSSTTNQPIEIIEEDLRKAYSQAVENLSIMLLPYFKKEQKTKVIEFYDIMNLEISSYSNKYKSKIKEFFISYGLDLENISNIDYLKEITKYRIDHQLIMAKNIYTEISVLLHKNKYFKRQTFGEGDKNQDEVVEIEEMEDL
ncbi:MAG: hypothetical protein PHS54_01365 [Clostridia bacterium]|nr:hypothetical protein [Clostridia bacterium]